MRRDYLLAGAVTVALTAASVTAMAAAQPGSFRSYGVLAMHGGSWGGRCGVPDLAGQQVTVVAGDMGGARMMGGFAMMRGRMMLHVAPQSVSSGTVSLRLLNQGTRTHELVVLPLAANATAGSLAIGSGNRVDEGGSLGEASNDCGSGSGEGIRPGGAGWITLTLQPGRYELLCNLRGHYAAGMFAELDVT